MDLGLTGKRALVTGGSRGIGKAVARQLLEEGASVVIAARDRERLDSAVKELSAYGTVHGVVVDTGSDESVAAMAQQARALLGGIDILINNAAEPGGHTPPPKFGEVTTDALLGEMNVKVMGYVRVAQAVASSMIENGWGRIVNVSGLAARRTGSMIGSARNVAVSALTKNLADELGPKGINVTCVHPGQTRTERTTENQAAQPAPNAIGRMVDAEEVATVITFLASERSVAMTGDSIAVGGGDRGSIYY
jgi:NAD(P)-dependent dehydrogenase (short-subunit alcohol dehydrogenase family)